MLATGRSRNKPPQPRPPTAALQISLVLLPFGGTVAAIRHAYSRFSALPQDGCEEPSGPGSRGGAAWARRSIRWLVLRKVNSPPRLSGILHHRSENGRLP